VCDGACAARRISSKSTVISQQFSSESFNEPAN
jgi:hypothetical protein